MIQNKIKNKKPILLSFLNEMHCNRLIGFGHRLNIDEMTVLRHL